MSVFDNITKIFSKKEEHKILGVDIGSSSIKIVQLSRKKGIAILDTFGEISLAVYAGKKIGKPVSLPTETLSEALGDLIKESQATANTVAFAVPLKSTLVFNLKIPKSIDKDKLDEIVKVEARKYIPVPITEVQMDWSILPATSQKEMEDENYHILVVAIHKETLNKYAKIASSIGLTIKFLEVETFSAIRSIVRHDKKTVAIVDIGAAVTKFYIVESGVIRQSSVINVGASKMLEFFGISEKSKPGVDVAGEAAKLMREHAGNVAEKIDTIPADLTRIVNEVKKIIIEYQKVNNKDVPEVILTGGGVLSGKIKDYFNKEMSVKVTVGDPFARVDNPAFLDQALRDAGATFAVAVGIALRGLK